MFKGPRATATRVRGHTFSRQKDGKEEKHTCQDCTRNMHTCHKLNTEHMAAHIHQISPRLSFHAGTPELQCETDSACVCVFAVEPPLYSFIRQ